jgi:hypothetical protein
LSIATEYPWQGHIRLTVKETGGAPWQLSLRRPEWCQTATLAVNGERVQQPTLQKGYFMLERAWQAGDSIDLDLAVEPVLVEPNPRVDAVRGCLAIQRGPLVYCLESWDQATPDGLLDVELDSGAALQSHWCGDLLGGVMVVEAGGYVLDLGEWQGRLYKPKAEPAHVARRSVRLTAIPYYAWGNRGIGSMRVWIPSHVGTQ